MTHKTKATLQGRQWDHSKQNQHTRAAAGGQSMSASVITGTAPLAQLMRNNQPPELSGATISKIVSCFLSVGCAALPHTPKVIAPKLGRSRVAYLQLGQPLGSMPRCFNSFRTIRLSHAERVASPSSCMAASIASSSAGSTRKAICLLPFGIFMFDMCLTLSVIFVVSRNVHHVSDTCKVRSPIVLPALTGPLTKPLYEVTVMADQQHTQTHPKFTWLFLATPKRHADVRPVIVRFNADTEEKARDAFPGWDLVFAAKIRSECPLYQYANGTFELNLSGLEVRHA